MRAPTISSAASQLLGAVVLLTAASAVSATATTTTGPPKTYAFDFGHSSSVNYDVCTDGFSMGGVTHFAPRYGASYILGSELHHCVEPRHVALLANSSVIFAVGRVFEGTHSIHAFLETAGFANDTLPGVVVLEYAHVDVNSSYYPAPTFDTGGKTPPYLFPSTTVWHSCATFSPYWPGPQVERSCSRLDQNAYLYVRVRLTSTLPTHVAYIRYLHISTSARITTPPPRTTLYSTSTPAPVQVVHVDESAQAFPDTCGNVTFFSCGVYGIQGSLDAATSSIQPGSDCITDHSNSPSFTTDSSKSARFQAQWPISLVMTSTIEVSVLVDAFDAGIGPNEPTLTMAGATCQSVASPTPQTTPAGTPDPNSVYTGSVARYFRCKLSATTSVVVINISGGRDPGGFYVRELHIAATCADQGCRTAALAKCAAGGLQLGYTSMRRNGDEVTIVPPVYEKPCSGYDNFVGMGHRLIVDTGFTARAGDTVTFQADFAVPVKAPVAGPWVVRVFIAEYGPKPTHPEPYTTDYAHSWETDAHWKECSAISLTTEPSSSFKSCTYDGVEPGLVRIRFAYGPDDDGLAFLVAFRASIECPLPEFGTPLPTPVPTDYGTAMPHPTDDSAFVPLPAGTCLGVTADSCPTVGYTRLEAVPYSPIRERIFPTNAADKFCRPHWNHLLSHSSQVRVNVPASSMPVGGIVHVRVGLLTFGEVQASLWLYSDRGPLRCDPVVRIMFRGRQTLDFTCVVVKNQDTVLSIDLYQPTELNGIVSLSALSISADCPWTGCKAGVIGAADAGACNNFGIVADTNRARDVLIPSEQNVCHSQSAALSPTVPVVVAPGVYAKAGDRIELEIRMYSAYATEVDITVEMNGVSASERPQPSATASDNLPSEYDSSAPFEVCASARRIVLAGQQHTFHVSCISTAKQPDILFLRVYSAPAPGQRDPSPEVSITGVRVSARCPAGTLPEYPQQLTATPYATTTAAPFPGNQTAVPTGTTSVPRPTRRTGATSPSSADMQGVWLKDTDGGIAFGPNREVTIRREGGDTLVLDGDIIIDGVSLRDVVKYLVGEA